MAFDGIENFRDFGGYAAGERRMKTGLLYRSAHQVLALDAAGRDAIRSRLLA
jgi:protein tyrosine/serine phosphatase